MHFRAFSWGGGYFWGVAKISNIFRVLDIPDISSFFFFFFFLGGGGGVWVNSKCWVQAYG